MRLSMDYTVKNEKGIHARAALFIVKTALKFRSSIWLEKGGIRVDAKDMLKVLTLGAGKGTIFQVIAEGDDAESALKEMGRVIDIGFGEMGEGEPARMDNEKGGMQNEK